MLLVICVVLLLWSTASYWQMQQAMRWWFKQEASNLAAYADLIQNKLIQDLFAVRLSLQSPIAEASETPTDQQQVWITQTEKLHDHLMQLSDELSQPYLAESLPLAIRSLLKQWQFAHPDWTLQLDLPQEWQSEPFERSRMILTTLETLLKLVTPASLSDSALEITLVKKSPQAELTIKITYADPATRRSITCIQELKYLCRCFRCLAPGRCFYQPHSSAAVWRFYWKS